MKINYVPRGIWSVAVDNAFEFEPIPPAAGKKQKQNKKFEIEEKRSGDATRRSTATKQNDEKPAPKKEKRTGFDCFCEAVLAISETNRIGIHCKSYLQPDPSLT